MSTNVKLWVSRVLTAIITNPLTKAFSEHHEENIQSVESCGWPIAHPACRNPSHHSQSAPVNARTYGVQELGPGPG